MGKPGPKRDQPLKSRTWALDQIHKQHPKYHPLVAMVNIAHRKSYTKRSREEFQYHAEIAKYIVAKPKMLDISTLQEAMGDKGEITLKWV